MCTTREIYRFAICNNRLIKGQQPLFTAPIRVYAIAASNYDKIY